MCFDSGNDLFYLTSDLHLRTKQLFRFFHFLTGDDLAYLKLHCTELIECDLRFSLDIDSLFFCRFFFFGSLVFLRMKRFHFLHHFIQIQTLEQDLRLISHMSAAKLL